MEYLARSTMIRDPLIDLSLMVVITSRSMNITRQICATFNPRRATYATGVTHLTRTQQYPAEPLSS
jgi:hypothetical protein